MSKRKYVVLGNGNDWCEMCLSDRAGYDNIFFTNQKILMSKSCFLYNIAKLHYSERINRRINLPFKSLWYNTFIDFLKINKKEDIVLVIYDWHILGRDFNFLQTIRKKYQNVKLVYVFTNIVSLAGAGVYHYVDELNKIYDAVFAFDMQDANKYGFNYSPLVYSSRLVEKKQHINSKRVFYVGKAKDRYGMLISVYEKIKELGIDSLFYIAQVDEEILKYPDEIHYNEPIPYSKAVEYISKSECLVDVIQGGSTGLTIKTCEAIFHNKKLITTNKSLYSYPFYDERYMLIINSADDITEAFFKENTDVNYPDEAREYFSLEAFLKKINEVL